MAADKSAVVESFGVVYLSGGGEGARKRSKLKLARRTFLPTEDGLRLPNDSAYVGVFSET